MMPSSSSQDRDSGASLALPTITDVVQARRILSGHVIETPLLPAWWISAATGAEVYLKAENLQITRSFKLRGATSMVSQLSSERRQQGVVTASRGNHALSVAHAAKAVGSSAIVVMPTDADPWKVRQVRFSCAGVRLVGSSMSEAANEARVIADRTRRIFVPAFDNKDVIVGQGTIGLEILDSLPDVEVILVPVGGGGLIGGIALAVKSQRPDVQIIGIQAKRMASMRAALHAGQPVLLPPAITRADGINVSSPSELTLDLVNTYVDDIVEVEERDIEEAMLLLLDSCNLRVEGAGAVGVAALLHRNVALDGKRVAVVLSGGNVDLTVLVELRRALTACY